MSFARARARNASTQLAERHARRLSRGTAAQGEARQGTRCHAERAAPCEIRCHGVEVAYNKAEIMVLGQHPINLPPAPKSVSAAPPLSQRLGMAQDCGACFVVCGDELQFAESSNCAGLPLGGRSFSRVLLPLRGLQSPLVRAAMPVGQTGRQSRCTGCVNSYHRSAETARLSTITIATWAKSSLAARCCTHRKVRLPAPARETAQSITRERRSQSRAGVRPEKCEAVFR